MKQDKTPSPHTPRRRFDPGRGAFMAYLGVCTSTLLCQPAFAADTIWTKASDIMKDVYTQILAISTIAAIVTAAVALLRFCITSSVGRPATSSPFPKRSRRCWPSTWWPGGPWTPFHPTTSTRPPVLT